MGLPAGGQIQGWNIVGTVSVLQFYGASAGGEGEELMAQANAHNGYLRGFHKPLEMVHGVLAMGGIAGPVGDEDAVEVVGDFVNGIVVWKACHRGPATDKTAEDILFDAAVDDGDVRVTRAGADVEGRFGADFGDEIDLFWVDEGLVLVLVVLFPDGDACERGALLAEVGNNRAGVDAGNSRDAFFGAPFPKTLHGRPMAVLFSNISNHHAGGLKVGGLEVSQ